MAYKKLGKLVAGDRKCIPCQDENAKELSNFFNRKLQGGLHDQKTLKNTKYNFSLKGQFTQRNNFVYS